ncbi:hypothetical protein LP419_21010 [Massilia sp. H-1]|nr:hypothetical protein LP419_21010 [Massilia sp. H-1]
MIGEMAQRGWVGIPELTWPAIKAALDSGKFSALASAYQELTPLRRNWEGMAILRSYRQGVALLRICLVGGASPDLAGPLLAACMACHEAWLSASAGRHLRAAVRARAVRAHPSAAARRSAHRADREHAARTGQRAAAAHLRRTPPGQRRRRWRCAPSWPST